MTRFLFLPLFFIIFGLPLGSLIFFSLDVDFDLVLRFILNFGLETFVYTFLLGGLLSFVATSFGFFWGYVMARYHFPFRKFFLFFLPASLAIPLYISAFSYLGFWQEFISYERPVTLFSMSFVLSTFPYGYLLSYALFRCPPQDLMDFAILQKWNQKEIFKRIDWPVAKPFFFSSCFIVLFEYFSDIGAAHLFGISTFSTMIYKIWTSYFSIGTASFLSLVLMVFVFILLLLQTGVRQNSFEHRRSSIKLKKVNPRYALLAFGTVFFSFFFPLISLLFLSFKLENWIHLRKNIISPLFTSVTLSFVFSICIVSLLFLFIFSFRRSNAWIQRLQKISEFGYALPGVILAIAMSVPFFYLQRYLTFPGETVVVGLLIIFFAWTARFLKVGIDPLAAKRNQIHSSIEEAAIFTISSRLTRWSKIYFPMMKSSLGVVFFLVFIESMKELPIILISRPLGWENLAVKFFEYSSESDWGSASLFGLLISLFGLIGHLGLGNFGDQND